MAFNELKVVFCPAKKHHKDKIILQTPSVAIVISAKQHQDLSVDSMNYQKCISNFPSTIISQLNDGFLNRLIRACTQNSKHRLGPRTETTSSPPFFLRDSRANETRAHVKIIPGEKRRHAVGREKNFSLSPPHVAFSCMG